MILWLDAQLSPAIAEWIRTRFRIKCLAIRDLGLRDAEDPDIFAAAKTEGAAVMTKDSDFVLLLERHGPPPQIVWLRSGNTSNAHLKQLLLKVFPDVLAMLESGEALVEVGDPWA